MSFCHKRENSGGSLGLYPGWEDLLDILDIYSSDREKRPLPFFNIPCAKGLSVSGFFTLSVLFLVWSRFIPEVFPRPACPTFLTFPEY